MTATYCLRGSVSSHHGSKPSVSLHVATTAQRRYILTNIVQWVVIYVVQVGAGLLTAINTGCPAKVAKKPSSSVTPRLCTSLSPAPIRILSSKFRLAQPLPCFSGAFSSSQRRANFPLVFFGEFIHYASIW